MKVFMTSRAFLILSFLWLLGLPSYAFFQNANARVKTKYEFTDTRISEADTLLKNREYQSALEAYQKAYEIYEAESFYEGMVYAKERMGRTYRSLGKDSLSKVTYQAAAALSREKLGPNHILESKAYLNNGMRAHYSEKSVEASQFLDTAHWLYDRAIEYDSSVYREIINFKYYAYYYSNLSRDTLIKYLNERGRIYEREGSSLEESVFFLTDYSRAYFRIGDFQKSIAYGIEAVRVSENSLELIQPFYYRDALYNLSRSLWSQNQHDQALDVIEKLILFTLGNNPNHEGLFGYYNLKALILGDKGDYFNAAKEFHRILDLLESRESNNESFREATVRDATMNLGVCYQLMGDYKAAKRYLDMALNQEKLVNEVFDTPFASRYKYLAQYFGGIDDRVNAVVYYDSALRNSILTYRKGLLEYPSDDGLNVTYENLSLLKSKQISMEKLFQSDFPDSIEMLKASIEYAENTHEHLVRNREELQVNEGRLFLSENFKTLYESAINSVYLLDSLEAGSNYLDLASKFISLSKSILFLEQSGELVEIQDSRLSIETKNQYYQIKTDIDQLENGFYQMINQVNTSDSLRVINEELLKLDTKLKAFRDSLKEAFGIDMTYGAFHQSDLRNIESYIGKGDDRAVIDFFVGDRYTFILGYSRNRKVLKRIELDSAFHSNYKVFVESITKRPDIDNYMLSLREYQSAASYLFSRLLRPLLDSFSDSISDLTIIPDDLLAKIPFEALVQNEYQEAKSYSQLEYLLLKYNINYSLSAKSIGANISARRASKFMFGIGYSGVSNQSQTRSGGLVGLPGTEDEIKFIEKKIGGDYFLGKEGTRQAFMANARNYDVLHLAVHGKSDSTNRYGSKLIFSNNDILETSDLYLADLKARLVVLSACESGVGEISKGEGTFSIARGFALVGVPTIVMSLWSVNDRVSSDLMVSFHQNLSDGFSVNESLSKTKRSYLLDADEFTSHPYYWSPFVSLGEEIEISENRLKSSLIVVKVAALAFILILLFIAVVIKKRKGA